MKARQRAAALLKCSRLPRRHRHGAADPVALPRQSAGSPHRGVTDAELLTATWQLLGLLILQYCRLVPAHHPDQLLASRLAAARMADSRRSLWLALMAAGLATAALPVADACRRSGKRHHPVARRALAAGTLRYSWRRWQFWLFTGVLSWGFVPLSRKMTRLFFEMNASDCRDGASLMTGAGAARSAGSLSCRA